MAIRKRHKVPKKIAVPSQQAKGKQIAVNDATAANVNSLPQQAEKLLEDAKNVQLLENVLNQINAYYDAAWNAGNEVLPIFVGLTPQGLLVELSVVRGKAHAGEPVTGDELNVFTYQIGTQLTADIAPRKIAEANMVKGQEQIRLDGPEASMPDASDAKALATWRFTQAETIQLRTLGIYEVQPENYDQLSFGRGVKALGGTEDSIVPLTHFAGEIK
ncbi:MAG TPA: hypothetical protein VIR03_02290 [Candidatus Saccharimonadales bacterium]